MELSSLLSLGESRKVRKEEVEVAAFNVHNSTFPDMYLRCSHMSLYCHGYFQYHDKTIPICYQ